MKTVAIQSGEFIKKNSVLVISFFAAVISIFFIHIDKTYISYIDFRTLSILLSLMLIMAGLKSLGVFTIIGENVLSRASSLRSLTLLFIVLCFVFSMFITNDVALITFVPFTIEVLEMADRKQYMIRIIVLETVAANLGSMLTPIGNPQNLYLYGLSGLSTIKFIMIMLPYSALSLLLLLICSFIMIPNDSAKMSCISENIHHEGIRNKLLMYCGLFVISILTVARIIPYYFVIGVVVVCILICDTKTITKADYSLILTFVFLFVFIGNIKRIPAIDNFLSNIVTGRETIVSIISSQVISNVPAAILLSNFTDNVKSLIIGTNLGGLGTLIASMASLISFKLYGAVSGSKSGKYLLVFTGINLGFLALLLAMYYLIH